MKKWILCFISLTLIGCAGMPKTPPKPTEFTQPPVVDPSLSSNNHADITRLKDGLDAQYSEWKGTRYKMGGNTKRGVDCSGFVHLTYRDMLGIILPRTTRLLGEIGQSVQRNDLQIGDLVLFKTGTSRRHVGIYMGNNKFLHASTQLGVTITDLNEAYWRKRYWKARRVDEFATKTASASSTEISQG